MSGPAPLALLKKLRFRRVLVRIGRDRLMVKPDDDRQILASGGARREDHMGEQRASAEGVQHLRQVRAHTGALARREDDRKACSRWHSQLLKCPEVRRIHSPAGPWAKERGHTPRLSRVKSAGCRILLMFSMI